MEIVLKPLENSPPCKVVQHHMFKHPCPLTWCCDLDIGKFVYVNYQLVLMAAFWKWTKATLYQVTLCIIITLGINVYWNIYILNDASLIMHLLYKQWSQHSQALGLFSSYPGAKCFFLSLFVTKVFFIIKLPQSMFKQLAHLCKLFIVNQ